MLNNQNKKRKRKKKKRQAMLINKRVKIMKMANRVKVKKWLRKRKKVNQMGPSMFTN